MLKRFGLFNRKRKVADEKGITTREALSNNWYVLKLAWSMHPQRVVLEFVSVAFGQMARVFYSLIFIKYLLESMEAGRSYESLAFFIVGTFLFFLLIHLFQQWYDIRFKPISDTILYEKLYERLFHKAAEVELNCYEDADFYNKYTTAMKEADARVQAVLANISIIIFSVIATLAVFSVMFSIDRYVIWFAILPLVGDFLFGRRMNQLYYKRYMDNIKNYRVMDYVNRTLYLQTYAKEIRLSNIPSVLKKQFYEGYNGVIDVLIRYRNRLMAIDMGRNVFSFLLMFQGVLLYGSYLAIVPRSITISEFAVLASAMVTGTWMLIDMAQRFVSVYENGVYINNLQRFLNYETQIKEQEGAQEPDEEVRQLVFSNVSFVYRGSDKPVMKNIDLVIPGKEKIALVGHNGAGKTTFTKLLMRLYDPTEGEVLLNGVPIQQLELTKYRRLFGVAFQDFQVFSMTIAENVLLREPQGEADRDRVKQALEKSGVYEKVKTLPKGIDTMLTREFDDEGAMLSGGELQKIAVARVFARDVQVVVMDEPSSALDPIAEHQLHQSIVDNCADKTVIFISHRLSSAVRADRIYMFEDGAIVEEGTHGELMQRNGRYAEMFRKQAEQYVEAVHMPERGGRG